MSRSFYQGEFDNLFDVPVGISIAHHEIHEGDMYVHNQYDEDAASGHIVQIFILTPAVADPQKRVHIAMAHESTGEHRYTITEGCAYSSGGAVMTPTNRERGSVKTSSLQSAYSGSDKGSNKIVVTGGTTMFDSWTGAGKTQGASSRDSEEWVLAPNTGYLFVLTSKAAGIPLEMTAEWYEHTDKV